MVSRLLQFLGAGVACGIATLLLAPRTYFTVAMMIFLCVIILLANHMARHHTAKQLEIPKSMTVEIGWIFGFSVLAGLFWPSLPLIAVYSWQVDAETNDDNPRGP
jgi:heme/copper-type cytochrome/quinol oxidase subunit 2